MNPLARLATSLALAACAACAGEPRHVSVAPSPKGARSLALLAGADPHGVDASIAWNAGPIEVARGDRLEYRVQAATAGLEQAGLEIRFDDRSILAPPAPSPSRWQSRTVDLGPHAGRTVTSLSIAARGPVTRPVLVLVDDVVIVRASGARELLFADDLAALAGESARIEARDGRAVCVLAEERESYAQGWLPASGAAAFVPWIPLELARPARAPGERGGALPSGDVLIDAGLPLRFADPDEAPSVALRGQRFPLRPVEGGRYYELALAIEGPPDARSTWEIQGGLGERGSFSLRLPPASGSADQAFHVLRVPVAASFAIESIRAPDDERLRLHAASFRWHRDAPADARFRRAWIASEEPSQEVARWLRNLELGAGIVALPYEEPYERRLFDLLLQRDRQGFRALLAQRLERMAGNPAPLRDARIACVPLFDLADLGEREVENVLALFDERPSLVGVLRDAGALAALLERRPALGGRVLELVRAGRVEVAGFAWSGARAATLTGEALRRDVALGLRWARAHGIEPRLGLLEPGTAAAHALPEVLAEAGITRAVSIGGPGCLTEAPAGLRRTLAVLALDACAAAGALERTEELARRLGEVHERTGFADLALVIPLDGTARDRRLLAALVDLVATDLAPRVRVVLASTLADELAARATGSLPALRLPPPEAPAAAESERRRAERAAAAALLRAERFGALAEADGLASHGGEIERAWMALLGAVRLAPAERDDAVARVRERAERLSREALAVLARAARTSGGRGEPWLVFNPLSWEREELVEIETSAAGVLDADLLPLAAQRTHDAKLLFRARVPALGYALFHLVPEPTFGPAGELAARFEGDELGWMLQSDRLACRVEPALGRIATLRVRPGEIELFSASSQALAWSGAAPAATVAFLREPVTLELRENGPLRATVRATRQSAGLRFTAEYALAAGSAELETRLSLEGALEAGELRALYLLAHPGDGVRFGLSGEAACTSQARDGIDRFAPADVAAACFASTVDVDPIARELVPAPSAAGAGEDTGRPGPVADDASSLVPAAGDDSSLALAPSADAGPSLAPAADAKVAGPAAAALQGTAFEGWVARGDDEAGLAVLTDSAAGFESPSAKVLSIALAPALEPGERTLERESTLLVARGAELPALASRRAEERAQPLIARPTNAHEGARPARHGFLSVTRSEPGGKRSGGAAADVDLEALFAEEGGAWILRLRERRGSAARLVLVLDRPIHSAETLDARGRSRDPLASKDRRVVVDLEPGGVESVRVRLRP